MEWMILPLKRYAQFSGRSRRMEFWMWVLFIVIVSVVLTFIDSALGLGGRNRMGGESVTAPGSASYSYGAFASGGILTTIFSLAVLIPNLAVSVRRLHDIDRTGWWILLPAAPYLIGIALIVVGMMSGNFALAAVAGVLMMIGFVCAVVLLIFYCLPGTRGPNRFGPDPLDPNGAEDLSDVFS